MGTMERVALNSKSDAIPPRLPLMLVATRLVVS